MTMMTITFPTIVIPVMLTLILLLYFSHKMDNSRHGYLPDFGASILWLLLILLTWLVYFIIF